jgi:hypothetical protein
MTLTVDMLFPPIGVLLSNLPIGLAILNKHCRVCSSLSAELVEHECHANFEGSSGAMESAALVKLAHGLLDEMNVLFGTVVADDDSSMRAQMKWSNADWMLNNKTTEPPRVATKSGKLTVRPDCGQLRKDYPEPKWLNDPSHRGKTLSGELRAFEKQPLAVSQGVNKIDCMKLQKNFRYMIKQQKDVPCEEWLGRGESVLEHHFENHSKCGVWCQRKGKTATELASD